MATNPPTKKGAPPAHGSGHGLGAALTTKYGPLPLWGWIGVAVVGFLLYRKLTGSSSSTAATAATTGTSTTQPTETVTTPYGSYTGPAQGGIPSSVLGPTGGGNGGGGAGAGNTGGGTPGSGGNSSPPPGAPYSQIQSNVANTVQSLLSSGQPVYYAGSAGAAAQQGQGLVQVTQPQAGGPWLFGGSPTAPGNPTGPAGSPSAYYVPVPAQAAA